jgi:hypothetical protein
MGRARPTLTSRCGPKPMSNAMKASLALGATAAAVGGVAYVSGQRKKSKEAAAAASKEHARQQQVVEAMILEFENFG